MASITIRGLDDVIKERLRARAFHHGCSMSDEARGILNEALSSKDSTGRTLADSIGRRFAAVGGLDLADLPRDPIRRPPNFGK
jgi:antitoxin FitA